MISSGLEAYHTTLLTGVCSILIPLGIPVVAYANHERISAFDNRDHGESVSPFLSCLLRRHRPLGVVILTSLTASQQEALSQLTTSLNIPVVHIAQKIPGQDCVGGDNIQGMRAVMAHLLDELEARRPAMVRGLSHQPDHLERESVFREEIARRGLVVDEDLLIDGGSEREIARNKMRELLARRRDMDAVVTTDDDCAQAVIDTLNEFGLRVPEDVSVTGFDNYPNASLSWPGITTVDQNLVEQGATAARLLLGRIQGDPPRGRVLTSCSLVVRGSTVRDGANSSDAAAAIGAIARAAQAQQIVHNGFRRIGRMLADCRTLDDIGSALADCLQTVGVERCFLVIHEGPPGAPDSYGITHSSSRLILDYREGRAHPIPDPVFSSHALLPDSLRGQFARGSLGFQPMVEAGGSIGYMLIDQLFGPIPVAEQLRREVARTVRIVRNTQELERRVEERTLELTALQSRLMDSARRAGMAEIATSVLHNVGNVLTSVNVSATLVAEKLRACQLEGLYRLANMLLEHQADLGMFLANDEKGRLLPEYLMKLSQTVSADHRGMLEELASLRKNIDHIRTIVTTQQSYAGNARLLEPAAISELIDDALRISMKSLAQHDVSIVKEVPEMPALLLDRACVVMILVNLISNADAAMAGMPRESRVLTIGVRSTPEDMLVLSVKDTGEGIPEENLDRIFTHGFTTRREGHGFGLHSSALAASGMGGTLRVHSDGRGLGALFTLELPMRMPRGIEDAALKNDRILRPGSRAV